MLFLFIVRIIFTFYRILGLVAVAHCIIIECAQLSALPCSRHFSAFILFTHTHTETCTRSSTHWEAPQVKAHTHLPTHSKELGEIATHRRRIGRRFVVVANNVASVRSARLVVVVAAAFGGRIAARSLALLAYFPVSLLGLVLP